MNSKRKTEIPSGLQFCTQHDSEYRHFWWYIWKDQQTPEMKWISDHHWYPTVRSSITMVQCFSVSMHSPSTWPPFGPALRKQQLLCSLHSSALQVPDAEHLLHLLCPAPRSTRQILPNRHTPWYGQMQLTHQLALGSRAWEDYSVKVHAQNIRHACEMVPAHYLHPGWLHSQSYCMWDHPMFTVTPPSLAGNSNRVLLTASFKKLGKN